MTIQLDEELTLKEKEKADKLKGYLRDVYTRQFIDSNPVAKDAFDRYSDNYSRLRARFPLTFEERASQPHEGVVQFLHSNGYTTTPEDYLSGIANKKTTVGNPEKGIPYTTKITQHRIGALLDKHSATPEIKKAYTNDTFRNGAKTGNFDIIMSFDAQDVYSGSTGRGWTSCADTRPRPGYNGKGPATRHLGDEINNNTMNAYLVPSGGHVDRDAIARVSFKSHVGAITGHQTLFMDNGIYGTPPADFVPAAKRLVNQMFPPKPNEIYIKNKDVYPDGSPKVIFPKSQKIAPEDLDKAHKIMKKNNLSDTYISELNAHIDPEGKYKSLYLRNNAKKLKSAIDAYHAAAPEDKFIRGYHALKQHLGGSYNEESSLANNIHIHDHIDKIAKHFDIENIDHVHALMDKSIPDNSTSRMLFGMVTKNLEAKNINQYINMMHLHDNGGTFYEKNIDGIPIADKHNFGSNRDITYNIAKELSDRNMLDSRSLNHIYKSTDSIRTGKRMNLFDTMIDLEHRGIHGMSDVIQKHAAGIVRRSKLSNNPMFYLGTHIMAARPENRERLAGEFNNGLSASQIVKEYKKSLK